MKTVEIPGLGGPSTPEREAAAAARREQQEYLDQVAGDPPETIAEEKAQEADAATLLQERAASNGEKTLNGILAKRQVQGTEKVELVFVPDPDHAGMPAFKLTFNVSDICERPNYVSLAITDDLGFQPSATMRFDLKYRGKITPVVFLGSEFEFQRLGVRGISFVVDSKRQQRHDQNR